MEMEERIMGSCNEIGNLATEEALKQLDTDGSPIKFGGVKMTECTKLLMEQLKEMYIKHQRKMPVGG